MTVPAPRSIRQVYARATPAQIAVLLRMAGSRAIIPTGVASGTTAALRAAGLLTPGLTLSVTGQQVAALATAVDRELTRNPGAPRALVLQRCADHLLRVSEAAP